MSILVLTLTLTLPNLAVTASRRLTQGGIDALLAAGSQLELFHVYDQSAPACLEYAEFRSAEVRRARTQHASRTHARTHASTHADNRDGRLH